MPPVGQRPDLFAPLHAVNSTTQPHHAPATAAAADLEAQLDGHFFAAQPQPRTRGASPRPAAILAHGVRPWHRSAPLYSRAAERTWQQALLPVWLPTCGRTHAQARQLFVQGVALAACTGLAAAVAVAGCSWQMPSMDDPTKLARMQAGLAVGCATGALLGGYAYRASGLGEIRRMEMDAARAGLAAQP